MSIEELNYDVLIIGAGPSGLSAAIKIKQLSNQHKLDLSVCVIEKASFLGGHIISGAVIDVSGLTELFPDWKNEDSPIKTQVNKDEFFFFSKNSSIKIPSFILPNTLSNKGNYIVSLSNVVKWLGKKAEKLDIDIFTGFTAKKVIYDDSNSVIGVKTGEFGIDALGKKKPNYEPSIMIKAKFSLFAEGSRGHLGKKLIENYKLDKNSSPQSYSLGIKELWQIPKKLSDPGYVCHGFGWPLKNNVYGGSFLYHMDDSVVSIGLIVGLNYKNPWMSPFEEFQKFKSHPKISKLLTNGKRIGYGARSLTTGGLFSLPQLTFPGGALIGCNAGFLNPAKIKGTHNAIKSGILVANAIVKKFIENQKNKTHVNTLNKNVFDDSVIFKELKKTRNFKAFINKGIFFGGALFKIEQVLFFKNPFFDFKITKPDYLFLNQAKKCKKIIYNKPDYKITFDRLSSLPFSGTNHQENQPIHLVLKNVNIPLQVNLPIFGGPETRYCPAHVYEYLSSKGQPTLDIKLASELKINAQNCLHCKACDIKDPSQNIDWITPEGGGGPNYENM